MQYTSSITHSKNLESGLAIQQVKSYGLGDLSFDVVTYDTGAVFLFTDSDTTQIHKDEVGSVTAELLDLAFSGRNF